MKKVLTLIFAAFVLLCGCAATPAPKGSEAQKIVFTGLDNSSYKANLISKDNFETAVFTDSEGNKFTLLRAPSGSGVRLIDGNGVEIHFAKGEGVLNLGNGSSDMSLTYKD